MEGELWIAVAAAGENHLNYILLQKAEILSLSKHSLSYSIESNELLKTYSHQMGKMSRSKQIKSWKFESFGDHFLSAERGLRGL